MAVILMKTGLHRRCLPVNFWDFQTAVQHITCERMTKM